MLQIINCEQCGKEYATHRQTTRFCGDKCRQRDHRKKSRINARIKSDHTSVTQIDDQKQSAVPEKATCVHSWQGRKITPLPSPKSAWSCANGWNACWCEKCWHYFRVVGARRMKDKCSVYQDALNGGYKPPREYHKEGFDCSQWYSDLLPHCENKALAETRFISVHDWVDDEDAK